jgi:hypothetical protein
LALREAELMQREKDRELELRRVQETRALHEEAHFREEERWKAEMAIRERELDLHLRAEETRRNDDRSLLGRTKKFSEAVKNIFPSMPTNSAELPSYFDSVDNLFSLYEVPADIQSKLLLPHLTGKAKSVVSKLSLAELNSYDTVKSCILREFQITPRELRSRFVSATKKVDESYNIFRGRLEMSLRHYLQSRNVDNFAKLLDLFVADKLKECLSPGALHYVLSLEGNKCFTSNDVASNADVYYSNYNEDGSYKASAVSNVPLNEKSTFYSNKRNFKSQGFKSAYYVKANGAKGVNANSSGTEPVSVNSETFLQQSDVTFRPSVANFAGVGVGAVKPVATGLNGKATVAKKLCFACQSDKHTIANCPVKRQQSRINRILFALPKHG